MESDPNKNWEFLSVFMNFTFSKYIAESGISSGVLKTLKKNTKYKPNYSVANFIFNTKHKLQNKL